MNYFGFIDLLVDYCAVFFSMRFFFRFLIIIVSIGRDSVMLLSEMNGVSVCNVYNRTLIFGVKN